MPDQAPVVRYRLTYRKGPSVRFISHLDVMRALERGIRRARLPLAYSRGFNPHARMSIAAPLPVGHTASADILDVEMAEPVDPETLVSRLRDALPADLSVVGARRLDTPGPAAMAEVRGGDYTVHVTPAAGGVADVRAAVARFLAASAVEVERPSAHAGPPRRVDIRPLVEGCEVTAEEVAPDGSAVAVLAMRLKVGSRANVKPEQVCGALAPPVLTVLSVNRDRLRLADDLPAGAVT